MLTSSVQYCLHITAGSGACSLAVKQAYPRCRLTVLDKSQFRLEQCRRQMLAVDTNFTLESSYNTEVSSTVHERRSLDF